MRFSISSCWNSHRHDDGYAMLVELANLGFDWVELSHGIRLSLVPGILKALDEGVVKISSVHNFCPLPVGVMGAAPNLYEPAAPTRRERILWLHNTLKTLDFADRVACDRVVLHSGRARFLFGNPGKALEAAAETTAEPDATPPPVENALRKLRKAKKKPMKRLRESFGLLVERARERGVTFGVENREAFTEMPMDEDMKPFLEEMAAEGPFAYWHDAGHAQLKERMGLLKHAEFLTGLRPLLTGFHLHDVSEEGKDHQPPGTGTIDWEALAPLIGGGDTVVMEMSPRLRSAQIREGRDYLRRVVPALSSAAS
ncbi:MAG: TIM barrel protein [Verrucomicrobia bacterium]|jgi:sugar phosphate isomerase/epimerase|nr:TIM barrel protein [Verrucomicrobiota bacterium]